MIASKQTHDPRREEEIDFPCLVENIRTNHIYLVLNSSIGYNDSTGGIELDGEFTDRSQYRLWNGTLEVKNWEKI